MVREDIDRLKAILLAAARGDFVAEHGLLAEVVHERREHEFGIGRVANRPAGEAARHRDHVVLRIAALDAERVQLHHLAAVVFVEPVRLLPQRPGENRVRHSVDGPALGANGPTSNAPGAMDSQLSR